MAAGTAAPAGAGFSAAADPLGRQTGRWLALAAAIEAERINFFTWVPVLFGGGIAGYFALPFEPSMAVALAVVVAVAAMRAAVRRGSLAAVFATGLLAASLGFAFVKARTEIVRAPVIERRLPLSEVRGFVELIEPKPQRGGRVTLRLVSVGGLANDQTPARARIRVMGSLAGFRAGDAIRLKATLSPPAAPALPGSYDFARMAWYSRLGAVGYALARPMHDETLGSPPLHLRALDAIARLRAAIGARITASLPGETGAIANALITGERGAITQATNDAYRDSGLFHALSISGLHMAVMAGAIFWSLRLVLACVPRLVLFYPVKKWAAVGAALGATFYLLISGSSPPTERSYIMIVIMFLAIILDRQALALRNIALSALLILAVYPESLLDLGFQMSYAAVAALVAAHEHIERLRASTRGPGGLFDPTTRIGRFLGFFAGIAISTVIASLAVAPFGAYYFHTSQQYAMLGNVLGLPVCDLYIMPLALAVLVTMPFGLETLPLWLMGLGIDLLTAIARFVGSLPGAVASVPAMPDAAFVAMVCGGIWLTLWNTRWRLAGIAPIAAGLALAPFGPRPDVLVSQDGQAVAARIGPEGLSALPVKGRNFELTRWLEHDGDGRPLRNVVSGTGFNCDAVGCTTRVKGLTLAVARHPAAIAEDCRRAEILVLAAPRPGGCTQPRVVLDVYDLKDHGTHALYIDRNGHVAVETVAGARGERPWSGSGLGKPPSWLIERLNSRIGLTLPSPRQQFGAAAEAPRSRLEAFAAPRALVGSGSPPSTSGESDAAASDLAGEDDAAALDGDERAADERR